MWLDYLMESIKVRNGLSEEWEKIKVCGEEHASYLRENPERLREKIRQINDYREKIMSSNLPAEKKEEWLKATKESLNYLNADKSDNCFLNGILLGIVIGGLGFYLLNKTKDDLIERFSQYVQKGFHDEIKKGA